MLLKNYYFNPPWWATLSTITFMILFIYLGCWQLERYHEKKYLQTTFTQRLHAAPLLLAHLSTDLETLRYAPLKVRGHFVTQLQFLLDNKVQNNQAGYEVLTVFVPDTGEKSLLINRGWLPQGPNRHQLPDVTVTGEQIELQGHIALPPKRIFALGNIIDNPLQTPSRLEALDMQVLTQLTQKTLYPFILLLDANQAHGYTRAWQAINTNPYRSLSYAFQWFAFAFTLLIIYIALNTQRKGHSQP